MRSQFLMNRSDSALLVVDLQQRLVPVIEHHQSVVSRCRFLAQAARILAIPVLASEQYPRGLGTTVSDLAELVGQPIEKMSFSACGENAVLHQLGKRNVSKVLICGIESHVCVQQTALDLLSHGYRTYVAVDAVGSRHGEDKRWALDRMQQAGVNITTAESAVFEWTSSAQAKEFKAISDLVKQSERN